MDRTDIRRYISYALLTAGGAFVLVINHQEANRAKNFCARFPPGTPFEKVQRAALADADAWPRWPADNPIWKRASSTLRIPFSFARWGMEPQYICEIEMVAGKVTRAEYYADDDD